MVIRIGRRRVTVSRHVALFAILLGCSAVPAWAGERAPVHVRPQDAVAAELLAQGLEASASFRHLVEALDISDVYVYVTTGTTLRTSGAGCVRGHMRIAAANSGGRFLQVTINLPGNGPALVAALAHELQHAAEVAMAPDITDAKTLARFYQMHGLTVARGVFCTRAAREVEARVLAEVLESTALR